MASTTTEKEDEKAMSTDVIVSGGDEGGERPRPESHDDGGGFFHIYKKGQGKWTRLGTAGGAALLGALTANFLYHHLPVWLQGLHVSVDQSKPVTIYIILGLCVGFALLVFWLMNKPTNADFLIATDSEMKKVNWTSKKDLIGSTKVVIIFMFFIAFLLFAFDIVFGYFFYAIDVLKSKPF